MTKTELLLQVLEKNRSVQLILDRAGSLGMPDWYLAAGCIPQTVWNLQSGFDPERGIRDYDLVYYDAGDTSYEAEDVFIQKGKKLFEDIAIPVEIRNEARVHLWHKKRFGKQIDQYRSTEEAIGMFPTIATSVGVKKDAEGKLQVYAPFGLDDVFDKVVRPNKAQTTEKIYQDKFTGWLKVWPDLKVIPWDEG